jgi:hypothetical protein
MRLGTWDWNPTWAITTICDVTYGDQYAFRQKMESGPLKGARCSHRCLLQQQWWLLLDPPIAPPGGPPSTFSLSMVVAAARPARAPPRGATIDAFSNNSGGHCRTHQQHPVGGQPSMFSSSTVVATVRPAGSTPQGVGH